MLIEANEKKFELLASDRSIRKGVELSMKIFIWKQNDKSWSHSTINNNIIIVIVVVVVSGAIIEAPWLWRKRVYSYDVFTPPPSYKSLLYALNTDIVTKSHSRKSKLFTMNVICLMKAKTSSPIGTSPSKWSDSGSVTRWLDYLSKYWLILLTMKKFSIT